MLKKLFFFGLVLALSGCTDKLTYKALNGTFSGQFYYIEPGKLSTNVVSAPVSVSFSGDKYSSTGNPDRIPAGGSGTVDILENDLLNFQDKNGWTANFNWLLILDGKYHYELEKDSLIITRYWDLCPTCDSVAPTLYQYRLKRIN